MARHCHTRGTDTVRTVVCAVLLLCAASLSGRAGSRNADAQSDSVLCTIGRDLDSFDFQLVSDQAQFSLIWDWTDSVTFTEARITDASPTFGDDLTGYTSSVELWRHTAQGKERMWRRHVPHSVPMRGLRLRSDGGGKVSLWAGDGTRVAASEDGQLTFHGQPGSQVRMRAKRTDDITVARNNAAYLLQPGTAPFTDMESLKEYLSQSTDSVEGLWQFMDRDISEADSRARLGGRYVLATVRRADSGTVSGSGPGPGSVSSTAKVSEGGRGVQTYDIIYVSGAGDYAGRWAPLQLRGHLRTTAFIDNFDLEWITANRLQVLDSETYATLSAGGQLLTLHFPLVGAQIRFRRMR